jgi:hypothetical protein
MSTVIFAARLNLASVSHLSYSVSILQTSPLSSRATLTRDSGHRDSCLLPDTQMQGQHHIILSWSENITRVVGVGVGGVGTVVNRKDM